MATQTLWVTQGCDLNTNMQLVADDGTYINAHPFVFAGSVRQNPYSNYPTANLKINVFDVANGNTYITLDAANTANIGYGSYIYAITQYDTTNNKTSILSQGDFIVNPSALVPQPLPPNVTNQILNDEFYALQGQNSFYLSFVPANTSNVIVYYNNFQQANSSSIYTITGNILVFANSCNQGDLVQAQTAINVMPL